MTKRSAYLDLMEKHRKELEEFPIAYAFNEEQLEKALAKLGAKKEECVSMSGHGDIIKRTDVQAFKDMFKRQKKELQEAMTDKEFAEAAFRYEMDNHEYAINWSGDEDVLSCFGYSFDDLRELELMDSYRRARDAHMKYMEDLDVI